MTDIRKIVSVKEVTFREMGEGLDVPITRVAAVAIITNPFVDRFANDLTPLYEAGRAVGDRLAERLAAELERPVVSYGKAAIVGIRGEFEHGGACIHPMLGKPMRGAIGGGKAVIPSNVKIGGPGTPIDVPLGHKDEAWSFDHFDTMTLTVADAPRADEIAVILAFADAGRPFPRCGSGPV
jgi:hypothetical protein